jgi:hypothetical protein
MIYLTQSHSRPPQIVNFNDKLWPTAPLIAQGNTAKLAPLGIYPHHPNTQPAPLGTQWELIDGEWFEQPLGTPEERQAALDAQAAADQRAQWATQAKTRRTRDARKTLAEPTTEFNLDAKLAAIQFIQEV